MQFRSVLMAAASGSGRDAALVWRAAVVANGGTVSDERLAIVKAFIAAEATSGAWDMTDDYWGLWAENEAQALTSLKQRLLATATAAPTFTTDRGYEFNGTTQYIDTSFIPSTNAVAMSANSAHIEVYERTNVSSNTTAAGTNSGSNRTLRIVPRTSGNAIGSGNAANATFTLPAANSQGLTQTGRSGALATDVYGAKNGVDMTRTIDPSGVGASLPSHALFIGALDGVGTASGFRACSVGFVSCGAALTEAQRLARYNAVQAWATAVGAQV